MYFFPPVLWTSFVFKALSKNRTVFTTYLLKRLVKNERVIQRMHLLERSMRTVIASPTFEEAEVCGGASGANWRKLSNFSPPIKQIECGKRKFPSANFSSFSAKCISTLSLTPAFSISPLFRFFVPSFSRA